MPEIRETVIECTNTGTTATFCSSESKWINKLYKLSESNPGCVEIIKEPDDNGGYILAHIPKSWMKMQPPRKVQMSDEQKDAAAARLAEARSKK